MMERRSEGKHAIRLRISCAQLGQPDTLFPPACVADDYGLEANEAYAT